MQLGFDEESFWDKTPRQIDRAIEARREAQRREHNNNVWLAWHIAALMRQKKLPDMKKLLVQAPRKSQTWQQQLEIARMWASMTGTKITKGNSN